MVLVDEDVIVEDVLVLVDNDVIVDDVLDLVDNDVIVDVVVVEVVLTFIVHKPISSVSPFPASARDLQATPNTPPSPVEASAYAIFDIGGVRLE